MTLLKFWREVLQLVFGILTLTAGLAFVMGVFNHQPVLCFGTVPESHRAVVFLGGSIMALASIALCGMAGAQFQERLNRKDVR